MHKTAISKTFTFYAETLTELDVLLKEVENQHGSEWVREVLTVSQIRNKKPRPHVITGATVESPILYLRQNEETPPSAIWMLEIEFSKETIVYP